MFRIAQRDHGPVGQGRFLPRAPVSQAWAGDNTVTLSIDVMNIFGPCLSNVTTVWAPLDDVVTPSP